MAIFQLLRFSTNTYYLLLLVLLCTVHILQGFNLDVRFPVVKEGKTPGSLFGFSVALHKQMVGEKRYLLLVGAPKEKAESGVKANETGDVYTCPVNVAQSDCTRMNLIGSGRHCDRVEDMWLGVTVASQRQPGGRILTCGHRFVKLHGVLKLRQMIGKCYIRGNDLNYNETDMHWQNPDQVCSHTKDITGEVMCNMGISAAITDTEVIVGAPGSFEWQVNMMCAFSVYVVCCCSFPGYSVAEGRGLLSQSEDTVVTGAPKDNKDDAKGSVILTVKKSSTSGDGDQLKPYLTLRGEQMGSYFGNSLAVADLNNDGWMDLIVGAPFYFDRKKELGGAVYVYMNENGSFRQNSSIILRGPRDSAFGMAVAAIGDVNQDGFQDIAVGAPFHGTGRVFIWTGSAEGISQEPSQVIEGEDIAGGGFKTFGYSINGGLDVDENRYPDMVVGSLDDRVALLRARPVIHLIKTLEVTPGIVDPKDCDNCVEVEVCFNYTLSTGDKDFRKNVTVKYTVEADLTRHNHRVRFQDNGLDSYTGFLSMPSAKCKTLRLGLVSPIRDKVEPVVFSLNVSLHEGHPKARQSLQNLDAFPVLSEGKASHVKKEIHFQKDCGPDNTCQSNLQMKAEFANEEQTPFPSASVKKVMLVVDVNNFQSPGKPAEDAHNAMLNVTIPPSLIYSAFRSKVRGRECSAEDMVVLCELGNPFTSNQVHRDLIQCYCLYSSAQYTGHTHFSGEIMGESGMKTASDVGSPVEFTFKVNVFGKPLVNLGNLEVEFDWPWEVANGKWLLYLTEIQTKGTSDSYCVPPGAIVNPLKLMSKARRRRKREEGSTEEVHPRELQASLNLKGIRKKSFKLDCVTGTAHCVKFICPLRNMNNTATIIVRARVWNSTMLEDYREAWRVTVNGKATLKLVTDKPTIRMNTESTEFTLNIDPELGEEATYQVPLWIIIVSAVTGILLLAFIILLMWKCGFFRRASTREMYEAKAQKAEMKTQPSEVERLTEE
uniref:Integrin alpha-2 domain-containing protein n=1 Tax=Oncorhynchus mykiss TaxID=8022 RepID=A0A8C7UJ89_ONCMY